MIPVKLKAPLKDYIWGGTRLKTEYHRETDLTKVAECWCLSCHKDGVCTVENGEAAGMLFTDYLATLGPGALGTKAAGTTDFPILIKLIDAADRLSVQVHPDNEYALAHEGEQGKTEMWYVVDAEPDAKLIYGFRHEIDRAEFRRRIEDNTLLAVTNEIPVAKGDVIFIDSGTLHAIGKGILIAEIQQNSNSTYRVYDYGRLGNDGKPRPLHIEKAIDVTRLAPPTRSVRPEGQPVALDGCEETLLARCGYFTVHSLKLSGKTERTVDETSFAAILSLSGGQTLESPHGNVTLSPADCIFLPANFGPYTLTGSGEVLETKL